MFQVLAGYRPRLRTELSHPAWLLMPLGLMGCLVVGLAQGYFQSLLWVALILGAALAALWLVLVVVRPENALILYAFAAVNLNGIDLPFSLGGVRLSPDIVLVSLLIVGTMLRLLHERRPLANLPISAPYLLFLAIPLVTLVASPVPVQSVKGLFRFVGYYALMWLIVDVVRTRQQVRHMLIAMMLSPMIPVLVGAFQAVTGGGQTIRALLGGPGSTEVFHRVYGLAGGPFTLGYYLVLIIPLLLVFFLGERKGPNSPDSEDRTSADSRVGLPRLLLLALLVGSLAALILTFIRGSWLALVVALIWLGVIRGTLRFRQLVLSIPAIVGLVIWTYAPARTRLLELSLIGEGAVARQELTLIGRLELWRFAWEWIVSSPRRFLAGVGMKAFDYFYILRSNPFSGLRGSLYWRRVQFLVGNRPHNEILGFWLDVGLVGLAALIIVLVIVVRTALRVYRQAPDSLLRLFALAFLASSVGMFVGALGDNVFSQPTVAVYYWLMTGLILAIDKHLMAAAKGTAPAAPSITE